VQSEQRRRRHKVIQTHFQSLRFSLLFLESVLNNVTFVGLRLLLNFINFAHRVVGDLWRYIREDEDEEEDDGYGPAAAKKKPAKVVGKVRFDGSLLLREFDRKYSF
jgi:hypothetical protein